MIRELVGKRVKELRISKNFMNQDEFSKKIGWNKTYLSRIESGKQNITIENLLVICNGLNVSFSEFFEPFNTIIDDFDGGFKNGK